MKKLTIKERLDKRNVPEHALITVYHSVNYKILYSGSFGNMPNDVGERYPLRFNEVHKNRYYEISVFAIEQRV